MSKSNDGGAAFPTPEPRCPECNAEVLNFVHGMSKRDYFAAAALTGMLAGITKFRDDAPEIIVNRPRDISELAYLYADVMLETEAKL